MTTAADQPAATPVTYETATDEQIAQARDAARRKLREADARRTPAQRRVARELLGLNQPAA